MSRFRRRHISQSAPPPVMYVSLIIDDKVFNNTFHELQYDQLCSKGNFSREDIVTVLTANQGNVEAAFQELNKVQLKPFLMRIWGQGDSGEVTSGQVPDEKLGNNYNISLQVSTGLYSNS